MKTVTTLVFVAALILMSCNKTAQAIPVDTSSTATPVAHILPVAGPHPPTPPKDSGSNSAQILPVGSPVEYGVITVIGLDEVTITTSAPDSSSDMSSSTAAPIHH